MLDDSGQLINSNNQYVIDENGEWLLVDTEGGVILGLDTGEGWRCEGGYGWHVGHPSGVISFRGGLEYGGAVYSSGKRLIDRGSDACGPSDVASSVFITMRWVGAT